MAVDQTLILQNILSTNNLVLLVVLAFPIISLLNNHSLRSKPRFLRWLRTSTQMETLVKGDDDGVDFDCVICLSELSSGEKFRVLPKCKHKFHAGCVDAWFETGQWSCPVCRSPVPAPANLRHRNGGAALGRWILLGLDKISRRYFGTIRSEIMEAFFHQECYFY